MSGFIEQLKDSNAVKIVTIAGPILALVTSAIYFFWKFEDRYVTKEDLNTVKVEIIQQLNQESAKLRTAYLNDLQERLEEVELNMEEMVQSNQPIPRSTRSKAKRLQRRIDEIVKR